MRTLASGLACAALLAAGGACAFAAPPLLDLSPHRSPFAAGCAGQPDGAPVPSDPRELVAPEIVDRPGLGVRFNGHWVDLHDPKPPFVRDPEKTPYMRDKPRTCGEWRQRVADGERYIREHVAFLRFTTVTAYKNLWRAWGLAARPADFDEQVIRRYGFFPSPYRNPYPLDGDDPNSPDANGELGGRGELPLGLTTTRDRSGRYDGSMTITCSACHNSRLGTDEDGLGFHWGRSNDAFDASLLLTDMLRAQFEPLVLAAQFIPYPFSGGRGISAALGVIDLLGVLYDMETLDVSPGLEAFPAHGHSGQVNPPDWWRRSHQTRQWLGAIPADNVRGSMALSVSDTSLTGDERRALEADFEDVAVFLESLSPPPYPEAIDFARAEAGAVLFHTRDLWSDPRNAAIDRPPTNGSCAGCHGVYSPRYAADPAMLPDPRLIGVSGYIAPIEIIGTDPARLRIMTDEMKTMWDTSWWAYDDLHPEWTRDGQGRGGETMARAVNDYTQNRLLTRLEGPSSWSRIEGYDTPSLYGAWATAPYLHNGSVPTIWQVLKPSERPAVWRRQLTAPGIGGKNEGFDYGFAAYDFVKLGWKHTVIDCEVTAAIVPTATCNPAKSPKQALFAPLSNLAGPYLWLGYQVPGPATDEEVRARQIYNTNEYSLGNGGHEFTEVLSDPEREAIIEYLKTL